MELCGASLCSHLAAGRSDWPRDLDRALPSSGSQEDKLAWAPIPALQFSGMNLIQGPKAVLGLPCQHSGGWQSDAYNAVLDAETQLVAEVRPAD